MFLLERQYMGLLKMIEQRSAEWFAERAGCITASNFSDAIAMKEVVVQRESKGTQRITKMVSTEARNTYMRKVVAEILSGKPNHSVSSRSMSWGADMEDFAEEAYELHTGNIVTAAPFMRHPAYQFLGASPDGLIGKDGGKEMKCPYDEQVHIRTWLEGMPDDHIDQVQGGMLVTVRKWWDFVSYHPEQAPPFRLFIQRIERDDAYINTVLLPGLLQFWAEVNQMVEIIKQKAGVK
jgi:hypothetical protein